MTFEEVYINTKNEFNKLTGKDNYKIYQNKYFIPLQKVFVKRLAQACFEYSLDDIDKIQNVILNHVKTSVENNFPKYTRTVEYYIYGQNGKDCQLAEDYENYDNLLILEKEKQYKSNIK